MTTRRNLLKAASLSGAVAALSLSPAARAQQATPPRGMLCVLVYGKSRRRLPEGYRASIVAIDLPSFEVHRVPSSIPNLHGLLLAGPGRSQIWGLGHESPERMDIFDRQLQRLEVRTYPGITFRGHGIAWREGVLVAAERTADPLAGGLLLEIDANGRCIAEHPTGGLRPHEIVACGDHFAVAHYGHKPAAMGVPAPLLFDTVSPGVSFLRKDSLAVTAFHRTPGSAATTHLGVDSEGHVLAMGLNTLRGLSDSALYDRAEKDGATLLPSEWYERGYEIYAPMLRLHPERGVVETLDLGAARMRRGQSFSSDASTGLVAATYSASQTLFVRKTGLPDKWLNTLEFGVPNPRGCAVISGTNWVAVSGNEDNVAIIDVVSGRLVQLVGTPLGGHSHMFWIPG